MIRNFILLFFSIFFSSCSNEFLSEDFQELNIYGNVKSVEVSIYDAVEKFGDPVKTNLFSKTTFDFDSNGNLIESNWSHSHGISSQIKYTLNDIGQKVTKTSLIGGEKEITKYDYLDGKINRESVYDSSGNLQKRTIYKYDENNDVVEETTYKSNGDLDYRKVNKRNSNGKVEEEVWYNQDGKVYQRNKYTYDEFGNEASSSNNLDGFNPSEWKNKYEFDKSGNWIKKTVTINSEVKFIEERTIQYY